MRFLILNTDYPGFLRWLYARHPGLEKQPYEEQMRARAESLFGVADFYSGNLRKLGHEAWDIHANNEFMQKAWAREHGMTVEPPLPPKEPGMSFWRKMRGATSRTPLRHLMPAPPAEGDSSWFYDILAMQIEHYKPDIIFNQDMGGGIKTSFLREMKPHVRLIVGQIASPLPREKDFDGYDLITSSLPNFVDYFRELGIPAVLNRLAFGPKVLDKIGDNNVATIPVSFIGSLSRSHATRVQLLEHLCQNLDMQIWGYGIEKLPGNSPIRQRYQGQAWGTEMYQILRDSKITINHHIGIAENYANNMRLYEATGIGTLLITDWKENLHEMFEPGQEVIAYHSPEECAELIKYYLEHEEECAAIARAGQQRTLREHTYSRRVKELVDIIRKYL